MRYFVSPLFACCFALSSALVLADNTNLNTIHLSPTPTDEWFDVLNGDGIAPGSEVVLSAGTYSSPSRLSFNSFGTAENPIVIRAAEGAQAILTRSIFSNENVIDVEGAQHVTFRGLDIKNGSTGVRVRKKFGRQPINLTFENLHVYGSDVDGFAVNDPGNVDDPGGSVYDGLIFRRNEINNVGGAGLYLGCNNERNASGVFNGPTGCVFKNGLVENNYIHDFREFGVGDGIQIKDGSFNNIVRNNVIHDISAEDGAVGILVYGTDGEARNIIEGNVIWNTGDNAIQAASEATIRNNIVFSAGISGIVSQNHQSAVTGNLTIVNNTVFSTNGRPAHHIQHYLQEYSGPVVVANNAFYATQGGHGVFISGFGERTIVGNVGLGLSAPNALISDSSAWNPNGDVSIDFVNFALMNAFPEVGSILFEAGDAEYQPEFDFNGNSRSGTNDAGAYVYDPNGNPGWAIAEAFKEFLELSLGDYDGDDDVDGADFLAWQRNTSLDSLSNWEANFGTIPAAVAGSTTVPEPSAIALALVAGCSLLYVRRSR